MNRTPRLISQRFVVLWVLTLSVCLPLSATAPRIFTWEASFRGDQEIGLRSPVDVAAAADNEIGVIDANGSRFIRFRFASEGSWWQPVQVVELPASPLAIAHANGRYIIALRGTSGLAIIDDESEEKAELMELPDDIVPGELAVDLEGGLLIADLGTARLLWMSADGSASETYPIEASANAVAPRPGGGFLVVSAPNAAVYAYSGDGNLDRSWRIEGIDQVPAWPAAVAVEASGDAVLVDRANGRLMVFNANGDIEGIGANRGWEDGLLLHPRGITRLARGLYAVADEGNGKIQIFRRSD